MAIFFLGTLPALLAANWYVDNAATGANTGTSWAGAWPDMTSVVWGASGVTAGDTLYISGGSVSKTYTNGWTVGANGTANNRITIRTGQDVGHNGIAYFDGGQFGTFCTNASIIAMHRNFITLDGEVNGQQHLRFVNWRNLTNDNLCSVVRGNPGSDNHFTYCVFSNVNTAIYQASATNTVIAHCDFWAYGDAVIALPSSKLNPTSPWDSHLIYSNTIRCAWNSVSGGPDGIQSEDGVKAFHNLFETVETAETNVANHTDYLQSNGQYTTFYENEFLNVGDSCLSPSPWTAGAVVQNIRFYNNIFRITKQLDPYPEFIRIYCIPGLAYYSNVQILNNLFIDSTNGNTTAVYFGEEIGDSPGTNNVLANNIFVNVGAENSYAWRLLKSTGAGQSAWSITNNIIYNVNPASSRVQYLGTNYTAAQWKASFDPSTGTNLPTFMSYVFGATNNNFNLLSSDTAAINKGIEFSDIFTADFTGNARGDQWDIGPFENQSGDSARRPSSPTKLKLESPP